MSETTIDLGKSYYLVIWDDADPWEEEGHYFGELSSPVETDCWNIGPFDERDAVVASAEAIVAKLED